MSQDTTIWRRVAITGGIASAIGASALLIRDAFTGGWSVDLALMPVIVGLSIIAARCASAAFAERRLWDGCGLTMLAVLASASIVYDGMGRRSEIRDAKVAQATVAAADRAKLAQKLAKAEQTLDGHRKARDAQCASGKGKLCTAASYTADTWEAAVKGYKSDLTKLPVVPIDAKADRVAAIAGLFGVRESKAKSAVALLDPLVVPLLLELGSIILFGFGLARNRQGKTAAIVAPVATAVAHVLTDAESLADLRGMVRAGAHLSVSEYADRWRCDKSESSRRIEAYAKAGLIQTERRGKFKLVVSAKPDLKLAA